MKRSDLLVQRSDWALLFAGLMMLVGPWVTANLDAAPPPVGSICVTMPGTKQCNTTGSTACGAIPGGGCTGACNSCDSTVVLPNKVCMYVTNATTTCNVGGAVNCGSNNNRLTGQCGKVNGSNNCTCNNAVPNGTCGGGYSYSPC